jgi:hypothetical protein
MGQPAETIFKAHEAQCGREQHQAGVDIEQACELIHDHILEQCQRLATVIASTSRGTSLA